MFVLYDNIASVAAQKVRVTLAEKGLQWTAVAMDLRNGDVMRPEYLALNPRGVVPTLSHDGAVLTESSVIIEYLDDLVPQPALRPVAPLARARMRGWMRRVDDDTRTSRSACCSRSRRAAARTSSRVLSSRECPSALGRPSWWRTRSAPLGWWRCMNWPSRRPTVTRSRTVAPKLPAKDVAELVALLKAKPGAYSYASGGNGTPAHLNGEIFKKVNGLDVVHVPYKGLSPAIQDISRGDVQYMFGISSSVVPAIKGGLLRETLADPATAAFMENGGGQAMSLSPVEFGQLMAAESDRWQRFVRDTGLKSD